MICKECENTQVTLDELKESNCPACAREIQNTRICKTCSDKYNVCESCGAEIKKSSETDISNDET